MVASGDRRPARGSAEYAAALEAGDYSIHFHTFTTTSFLALLLHCRKAYELPLEVVASETNHHEFIVIACRTAGAARLAATT